MSFTAAISMLLCFGLAASAQAPSQSTPRAPQIASTPGSVGLWAADWGGAASQRTAAGWQAAAQNYHLLVGPPGVYKNWIPQLHAWNPKLILLAYNLGPFLQKGSPSFDTTLSQHPDWFAHDAKGNMINLLRFPSNYLMEQSNAAYRAWHSQLLVATVTTYGFDGAMDDSMGAGPLGPYASGVPVNPATKLPYTASEYLNNSVLTINGDKAALLGKYLAFNGLISGVQYYDRSSQILATSNADAGVSELFLRQPTSPVTTYPTAKVMADTLNMMGDMTAHGKALLGWTKVWSTGTPAQIAQWQQFALGAYLLGQKPLSHLDFMPSHNADNTTAPSSYLQTQLGKPLGAYKVSGSIYTRAFANGTVTVDLATGTATIG